MTLPASVGLVRFHAVVIGTTAGAARMRISGWRALPSIRRRRSLRGWHVLTIGRCGRVRGGCIVALSERQAGCPEKNAQRDASRQKTVHDTPLIDKTIGSGWPPVIWVSIINLRYALANMSHAHAHCFGRIVVLREALLFLGSDIIQLPSNL